MDWALIGTILGGVAGIVTIGVSFIMRIETRIENRLDRLDGRIDSCMGRIDACMERIDRTYELIMEMQRESNTRFTEMQRDIRDLYRDRKSM